MAFPALESQAPEDQQSPLSQDQSIYHSVRDDPSWMVAHDCPLMELKTVLYQDHNSVPPLPGGCSGSQVTFTTVTILHKPQFIFIFF